jgi:hypothetical protein
LIDVGCLLFQSVPFAMYCMSHNIAVREMRCGGDRREWRALTLVDADHPALKRHSAQFLR